MKNYLLPIYHSKLKPWIKWWLLKQLELRSKTLSDWIEGTTPITITGAFKEKIQNLELEGNTSQTGTPSPTNPSEVHTVSGANKITLNGSDEYDINLASKNLYDKSQELEGKLINSGGGIGNDSSYNASDFLGITDNTTITLSTNTTSTLMIAEYDSTQTFIKRNIKANATNYTITTSSTTKYIRICYFATVTQVQLEKSSQPTTYEPYYNYELCKIGDDYSDYILPDTNGYKIIKNVGKVVYNGTENWYFTSNCCYINNIVDTVKRPPNNNTKANILCDHYQIDTLANCYNNVTDKRISVNNGGYLYIYDTSFTSANDIKTWLATNNVTVYYQLAATTTETITNTNLISQLDAIYNAEFKNGTNTITQTNSDLPFILHFKYYKKG